MTLEKFGFNSDSFLHKTKWQIIIGLGCISGLLAFVINPPIQSILTGFTSYVIFQCVYFIWKEQRIIGRQKNGSV